MNKATIFFLIFSCLIPWISFSQLDYKQVLRKKDDILLKSNRSTSDMIDEFQLKNDDLIYKFEAKRARLIVHKEDCTELNYWREKADLITGKTTAIINRILEEMNTIAQLADKSEIDYIHRSKYSRLTQSLSPLLKIKNLTNRTVPVRRLLGNNIDNPNPVGLNIEKELSIFKNDIFEILANYFYNEENYFFMPQATGKSFEKSLIHVKPSDRYYLQNINEVLKMDSVTYLIDEHTDETVIVPWLIDNFFYSSVLETAVIINQIVLKLKIIENKALSFLLSKVEAPSFFYNKISPYVIPINESSKDVLSLKVVILAEDTTKTYEYRYSFNKNVPKKEWKTGKGVLSLQKDGLDNQKVIYGETKIFIRRRPIWRPWVYRLEGEQ